MESDSEIVRCPKCGKDAGKLLSSTSTQILYVCTTEYCPVEVFKNPEEKWSEGNGLAKFR